MCTLTGVLTKPKTTGTAKVIRFKRRQQKRNPRRPLEAVAKDFERWDAAASRVGLNWSEFTRRALNAASDAAGVPTTEQMSAIEHSLAVSEKGGLKKRAAARAKPTAKRAVRKG